MAKKARTPPPPRRPVQAPSKRAEHKAPRDSGNFLYLLGFAALGLIILGAVGAFFVFGGSSSGSSAIETKYCSETSYKGLSPRHLSNPDARVDYNSFPPSSGPHYQQPAPWNLYTDPVKQTILVHNLEHGGIVTQYGTKVSSGDVDKISSWYQKDPYGLVVAPYSLLKDKIALTAWNEPTYDQNRDSNFKNADSGKGYVLLCTRFDEKAMSKFRDEHRNKSGERYPSVKDMTPG